MSLQSRAEVVGQVGDPGEKIPPGTRPLVECTTDASFENTSASTGGFQCPLRKVFSLLPHRQTMSGTEDA